MVRLLVPLDGSKIAEQALTHALAIASSFQTELFLIQVVSCTATDGVGEAPAGDARLRMAEARIYLQQIQSDLAAQGIQSSYEVVEGRAAEQVIVYAKRNGIHVIALTTYGRGCAAQFAHGSVAHKIVTAAGLSILLVRPDHKAVPLVHYRKVLVPLDGSYNADWTLSLAASIAQTQDAHLILAQMVHVATVSGHLPASQSERELRERLEDLQKNTASNHLRELNAHLPIGIQRETRVIATDDPARAICALAESEQVDLVIANARGRNGLPEHGFGAIAETLLNHSTRPVLVLQEQLSMGELQFERNMEPLAAGE